MVAEEIGEAGGRGSRKRVARLVYAVAFLVCTNALLYALLGVYERHLAHTDQYRLLGVLVGYFDLVAGFLAFLELTLVVLIFFPGRASDVVRPAQSSRRQLLRNVALGLGAGLVTFLVSAPIFLVRHGPSNIGRFLDDHFLSIYCVTSFILFIFLLPVASEIFFRKILLGQFLEMTSLAPALTASALLFAYLWPVFFNPVVSIVLALTTGILFYRTRSVLACVVADSFFTLFTIVLLMYLSLS